MTFPELKKYLSLSDLKQGDIVRHTDSGAAYTVLQVVGGVPIVARTLQIHNASEWELVCTTTPVNEDTKPAPSLTVKGPRPLPSRMDMWRQLKDAGWFPVSPNVWKAPGGALRGGIEWAWRRMDNDRIDACTAAGARPVKSFAEARAVLVSAGWKNICGKVWKSPSGALVEGTLAAYKIVTCPADTTGDCNAS